MKRKFTFLIACLAFSTAMVLGQTVSYQHKDGTILGDESTIYSKDLDVFDHVNALVDLKNLTSETVGFTFDLEILETRNVLGVSVCGFGGCVPVSATYSNSESLAPNAVFDFWTYASYINYAPEYGNIQDLNDFYIKMKFTVTIGDESHVIYMVLTSDPVSIGQVKTSDVQVHYEGGVARLDYSFATDAKRILNLYDITGRKITEMLLSNNTTSVYLPRTNKGIYLYSITEKGRIIKSGKYIVK